MLAKFFAAMFQIHLHQFFELILNTYAKLKFYRSYSVKL